MSDDTTKTFTIRREELSLYTVHDVVAAIDRLVGLTPEQLFRVTAIVKRYTHYEKHDMYSMFKLHMEHFGDHYLTEVLPLKIATHKQMKSDPDEVIVTWDVGTHKFKQKED